MVLQVKHKKGIKIKTETLRSKIMDKYAQLKKFHHDRRVQVYMYAFMYVYPDTIPLWGHFTATKTFVVNYKKMSTPGSVPKHWLGLNYICSEDYELDQNFYYTDFFFN